MSQAMPSPRELSKTAGDRQSLDIGHLEGLARDLIDNTIPSIKRVYKSGQ